MFDIKVTVDTSPVLTEFLERILLVLPDTSGDNAVSKDPNKKEQVKKKETVKKEIEEEQTNEEDEIKVSFQKIRALGTELMKAGKGEELQSILKSHKVEKLSELNESDYKSVYDAMIGI